jgi:hypothetical protein
MRERLREYSFEVEYIKGKENINADAPSRQYEESTTKKNFTDEELMEKMKPKLKQIDNKFYWETKDGNIKEVQIHPREKNF